MDPSFNHFGGKRPVDGSVTEACDQRAARRLFDDEPAPMMRFDPPQASDREPDITFDFGGLTVQVILTGDAPEPDPLLGAAPSASAAPLDAGDDSPDLLAESNESFGPIFGHRDEATVRRELGSLTVGALFALDSIRKQAT